MLKMLCSMATDHGQQGGGSLSSIILKNTNFNNFKNVESITKVILGK